MYCTSLVLPTRLFIPCVDEPKVHVRDNNNDPSRGLTGKPSSNSLHRDFLLDRQVGESLLISFHPPHDAKYIPYYLVTEQICKATVVFAL